MTRLTGKRSIESYNVKKDAAKPAEQPLKEEVTAQPLKTSDYMEMIKKAR